MVTYLKEICTAGIDSDGSESFRSQSPRVSAQTASDTVLVFFFPKKKEGEKGGGPDRKLVWGGDKMFVLAFALASFRVILGVRKGQTCWEPKQ